MDRASIDTFLVPITSPDHLRNWVYFYLGIDLPLGYIDPDSNSSPADWVFEAYDTYRHNRGGTTPGFIILSAREGYKTLSEAILAVLLMTHFGCTVAHLAAIEPQASKAISYVNSFINKIKPYAEHYGRKIESQSKRKISIIDNQGHEAYVNVVIATMTGANSEHTNVLSIDEIDVMRFPTAYEEAKLIPGVVEGQFPLTIKTSTRKFAFGLMERELNKALEANEKILRWNVMDVTERCSKDRHKPELPKVKRYIREKQLPLVNISEDEFKVLANEHKSAMRPVEAYAGCASCPLLSVCQMRLAHRNPDDFGGLYKPIQHVINLFSKISPDMAEAQLMCWKPSTRGLIYPKYDNLDNVLTVAQAYERFTGNKAPPDVTFADLIRVMLYAGVKFYGHVDWGYRHNFACLVTAQMPNGEWWFVDCFVAPGMELDDMVKLCKEKRDIYRIKKWMADTAYPANIKTFRRNGLPCVKFKKDVDAGIELVRTQVIDANNVRRLKIVKTIDTEIVTQMFMNHHFKLDAAGNPTREPDDEEFSDIADAARYGAQVLFKPGGGIRAAPSEYTPQGTLKVEYSDWMTQKVSQLTHGEKNTNMSKTSSGGIYVDFTDPTDFTIDDT